MSNKIPLVYMVEQDHINKINEIEIRLSNARGKCKLDLARCLNRLKRELRVYRSYKGNSK